MNKFEKKKIEIEVLKDVYDYCERNAQYYVGEDDLEEREQEYIAVFNTVMKYLESRL